MPFRTFLIIGLLCAVSMPSLAQERHKAMDSKWWVTGGSFLAHLDLSASAEGTVPESAPEIDLERALGLKDSPTLFMGEFGWQFGTKWSVALQYFRASQKGSRVLDEQVEWDGNTYDVGASIRARTATEITRLFFARQFGEFGPHSIKLGAGMHLFRVSAEVSGEATLDDMSTEFRKSVAKAQFPIPNIGAWYRYSPNQHWLFNARVDWLSATVDNYSGGIWNVSVGATYAFTDHFGIGANYQFFEISGDLEEDKWRGDISSRFTGPYVYLMGFW